MSDSKRQPGSGPIRPGLPDFLARLNLAVERVEGACTVLSGLAILAIMVIVFVDVFLRYFFRSPFAWSYDLISLHLVPVLFFLVISQTFRNNHHVAVDVVYLRFSLLGKRIARLLVALLMLPIVWELARLSSRDSVRGYRNNEVLSGAILWPTWIPLAIVALGFGLLLMRLVLDATALAAALAGRWTTVAGESPPRERGTSHDEDLP